MSTFDPDDLASWTEGQWLCPPRGPITGFAFDARQLKAGQCFVALSGASRDGHAFVDQAAAAGASAVLVSQKVDAPVGQLLVRHSGQALGAIGAARRSAFGGPVIAVTGSCGKTSTKEMLRCLLGAARTHATPGNWNNQIGVPMTLLDLDPQHHDFAVIEAGINEPGEMEQLGRWIAADLNILTCIGDAHLEKLGCRAGIAREKSRLLTEARPGSPIVLPAAALAYAPYAAQADRAIALVDESGPAPPVRPRHQLSYRLEQRAPGRWTVLLEGQDYEVATPSRGVAGNAALALSAALELGLEPGLLAERLQAWRPGGDRGAVVSFPGQRFYVDCYNANPTSMEDALDAFTRAHPEAEARLYVLGAMNEIGAAAVEKHLAIGRRLRLRPRDHAAFVGPSALTQAYLEGAREAGAASGQLTAVATAENLNSIVAAFRGAVFLKGSRRYRLESLLPAAASASADPHGPLPDSATS